MPSINEFSTEHSQSIGPTLEGKDPVPQFQNVQAEPISPIPSTIDADQFATQVSKGALLITPAGATEGSYHPIPAELQQIVTAKLDDDANRRRVALDISSRALFLSKQTELPADLVEFRKTLKSDPNAVLNKETVTNALMSLHTFEQQNGKITLPEMWAFRSLQTAPQESLTALQLQQREDLKQQHGELFKTNTVSTVDQAEQVAQAKITLKNALTSKDDIPVAQDQTWGQKLLSLPGQAVSAVASGASYIAGKVVEGATAAATLAKDAVMSGVNAVTSGVGYVAGKVSEGVAAVGTAVLDGAVGVAMSTVGASMRERALQGVIGDTQGALDKKSLAGYFDDIRRNNTSAIKKKSYNQWSLDNLIYQLQKKGETDLAGQLKEIRDTDDPGQEAVKILSTAKSSQIPANELDEIVKAFKAEVKFNNISTKVAPWIQSSALDGAQQALAEGKFDGLLRPDGIANATEAFNTFVEKRSELMQGATVQEMQAEYDKNVDAIASQIVDTIMPKPKGLALLTRLKRFLLKQTVRDYYLKESIGNILDNNHKHDVFFQGIRDNFRDLVKGTFGSGSPEQIMRDKLALSQMLQTIVAQKDTPVIETSASTRQKAAENAESAFKNIDVKKALGLVSEESDNDGKTKSLWGQLKSRVSGFMTSTKAGAVDAVSRSVTAEALVKSLQEREDYLLNVQDQLKVLIPQSKDFESISSQVKLGNIADAISLVQSKIVTLSSDDQLAADARTLLESLQQLRKANQEVPAQLSRGYNSIVRQQILPWIHGEQP